MQPGQRISAAEARRVALAAQGLASPRDAAPGRRQLRALVARLGVIQIDSVNVLVRSHYLPAFSRLGAYDRDELDRLSHRAPRAVFEYWGHEASLLPVELHPLMRWRMARAGEHAWGRMRRIARDQPALVRRVLDAVAERGPIAASELETRAKRKAGWWEWSDAKTAIEWLFWSGQVASARRRGFERLYDLPERVIPPAILARPTPPEADAQRALVELAARALGIATEADLRDYFRLRPAPARAAIAALVEAGVLVPTAVEGWRNAAYLHAAARAAPVAPERTALLSPFDSLVWARARTERLFGMTFRLEIYVPPGKRVHGYYVLPMLLGDRLVARVDLKADRAAGALRVQAAHAERGVAKAAVAGALARELAALAAWLELPRVEIVRRGDLATALARVIR
jgi:hypothetical protein